MSRDSEILGFLVCDLIASGIYGDLFIPDSYSNLVYQSACDKLKEKVQDERTKYLIKSLMPYYG